jgi:hypothetical protein
VYVPFITRFVSLRRVSFKETFFSCLSIHKLRLQPLATPSKSLIYSQFPSLVLEKSIALAWACRQLQTLILAFLIQSISQPIR